MSSRVANSPNPNISTFKKRLEFVDSEFVFDLLMPTVINRSRGGEIH